VVQSHVPAHAELHLLLSMITPVGWLERVPTYKEKRDQLHIANPSYGLLGYPVLMAADILVYRADVVPVGRDQEPHLELTREIARRFNHLYRELFPEPQSLLTEFAVLPGLDGRKMSKSYGNCIYLSDTEDEVREKVRSMFTDPQKIRKADAGHPEECPVQAYHVAYAAETAAEAARACRAGELGCVAHKAELADILLRALEPHRRRREELVAKPEYVDQVIAEGAERARKKTGETMEMAWRAMRLR
jgi:tryptophanyl-tRNA synthetase